MSRPYIISIEGNIGTGKSTILANLEKHFGGEALFLKEPVGIWESITDEAGNTILQKFYGDQRRYAFTFQVMAYITRLCMLKEAIKANPDYKVIIVERSLIADKNIFVEMLHYDGFIDKLEYDIYNKWYDAFIDEYRVDAIIYMDSSPEVCHQRINKRNRHGEEGIPLSYLEKCRDYHTKWLVNTIVKETYHVLHDGLAATYKIKHENHEYSVLHIDSSDDVSYDGDDDKGVRWINLIKYFLEAA